MARSHELVIQFPIASMGDFDEMIAAEERMREALKKTADVQNREHNAGECNVYIDTDAPDVDAQTALQCLPDHMRVEAKAATRPVGESYYKLIWPPGATGFRII